MNEEMRAAWDEWVRVRRRGVRADMAVAETALVAAYLAHVPEQERKIAEASVQEGQEHCCCCANETGLAVAARGWCMAMFGWPL